MEIKKIHSWYFSSPEEAEELQKRLSERVVLESKYSSLDEIKAICGIDVHFLYDENTNLSISAVGISILSFPDMEILNTYTYKKEVDMYFPYKSGLLAFRELPLVLEFLEDTELEPEPEVFIYDGQGIAHPRGLGVASHLGLFIDKPVIGCSKKNLYGRYDALPPDVKGSYTFIKDPSSGNTIGLVLRSKPHTKPLYISIGYMISLELARDIVVASCKKYRLPEPLRVADQLARSCVKRKL
jgi:deoxyribonuclease V